jgi:hypothetical protein
LIREIILGNPTDRNIALSTVDREVRMTNNAASLALVQRLHPEWGRKPMRRSYFRSGDVIKSEITPNIEKARTTTIRTIEFDESCI